MAERRMPRGLLDPESEAIAEAYAAIPSVRRQTRGLLSLDPQEDQSMTQAALEMALSLFPGVAQALAARDIERARRANDPAAAAMAATEFVPFGRMLGGMRRGGPIMSELDVYHGTPHRFPATETNPLGEFDASKIGTGEGQQVYGHGIYLAEAQDVGDSYRRALTPHQVTPDAAQTLANYAIRQRREPEAAIQWLEKERKAYKETPPLETMKQYDDAIAILRQGNVGKVGNLYKADLPDEMIDRMLAWDKPLSKQPKAVRELLKKSGITSYVDEMEELYFSQLPPVARKLAQKMINGPDEMVIQSGKGFKNNKVAEKNWNQLERLAPGVDHNRIHDIRDWYQSKSGADLYAEMSRNGVQDASERLRQMGIPGIAYLDADSRGKGGSGTRNFVVFPGEEKKVKILERK